MISQAEKRRRRRVDAMLYGNMAHARKVAAAVTEAVKRGERDAASGASMLRSIEAKIERWRRETYS